MTGSQTLGMATSVGVWFRVSSDAGQDERNQVPDVERHCEQKGYRINKRYELHDVSASKGAQEAALKEALNDIRTGVIKKLVCWHSDRLDRRGVVKALSFIIDVKEAGGIVESVKEGVLDEESLDTIVTTWISHKKSTHLSEQVGISHDRIRANEAVLGRAPFGYKITGDKYSKNLEPTPLGLSRVPVIFDKIINGDSLATVAKWLNAEHVPTACKTNNKRQATKNEWTASTLRQVIRNTAYKGIRTSREGEYRGKCPAIIRPSVWQRANDRLDNGPKRGPENAANKKLLTSYLFCGECGSVMYPVKTAAKEPYYRCSGKAKADGKSCFMVKIPLVDGIVSESMASNLQHIWKTVLKPGKNYEGDLDAIKAQIKALDPDSDDYDDRHAQLMAERKRLRLLDTTPDEWVSQETDETYADKWNSADLAGKRDMLKDWRITFTWSEIAGERHPSVVMVPKSIADGKTIGADK